MISSIWDWVYFLTCRNKKPNETEPIYTGKDGYGSVVVHKCHHISQPAIKQSRKFLNKDEYYTVYVINPCTEN